MSISRSEVEHIADLARLELSEDEIAQLEIDLSRILEAKYTIAIGGMLLGNALSGNIIATGNFYERLKRDEDRYLYYLATGASKMEALFPYFRGSIVSALKPTVANMATMGIVFLPGMMTGQDRIGRPCDGDGHACSCSRARPQVRRWKRTTPG